MTNLAIRHIVQAITWTLAIAGVLFGIATRGKPSFSMSIIVWLCNVAAYYGMIFAYRLRLLSYGVYINALSTWTPLVTLHGVIAALFTLHMIRRRNG